MSVIARKPGAEKAVLAADDYAIMRQKRTNKRTWDYIWRSGVAGGMAGCAVRLYVQQSRKHILMWRIGKNSCGTSR